MRFIQFWILPSDPGLESSVQQRQYGVADRADRWLQIMGPAGEDGLDLSQDARVFVSRLQTGGLAYSIGQGRGGYLYVIDGILSTGGDDLETGDAIKIEGPGELDLTSSSAAEVILVDVPLEFEPIGVWANR
jgi:redox-sensitive bicupin YhaK (pirin superfamily)